MSEDGSEFRDLSLTSGKESAGSAETTRGGVKGAAEDAPKSPGSALFVANNAAQTTSKERSAAAEARLAAGLRMLAKQPWPLAVACRSVGRGAAWQSLRSRWQRTPPDCGESCQCHRQLRLRWVTLRVVTHFDSLIPGASTPTRRPGVPDTEQGLPWRLG